MIEMVTAMPSAKTPTNLSVLRGWSIIRPTKKHMIRNVMMTLSSLRHTRLNAHLLDNEYQYRQRH